MPEMKKIATQENNGKTLKEYNTIGALGETVCADYIVETAHKMCPSL